MLGNSSFNPGLNHNVFNCTYPIGECADGGAAVIVNKPLQHSSSSIVYISAGCMLCSIFLDRKLTTMLFVPFV